MSIYDDLQFFTADENWGEPYRINHQLLYKLDALRRELGQRIVVTCGTQGKHTELSEHYKGNAVDVVCPTIDVIDFYLMAERFDFTGLGVYVDWRYGGIAVGGLHLDVRSLPEHMKAARWLSCAGKYYALNVSSLKKFKLI